MYDVNRSKKKIDNRDERERYIAFVIIIQLQCVILNEFLKTFWLHVFFFLWTFFGVRQILLLAVLWCGVNFIDFSCIFSSLSHSVFVGSLELFLQEKKNVTNCFLRYPLWGIIYVNKSCIVLLKIIQPHIITLVKLRNFFVLVLHFLFWHMLQEQIFLLCATQKGRPDPTLRVVIIT